MRWYLERGLATAVPDQENTIRLTFQHQNSGKAREVPPTAAGDLKRFVRGTIAESHITISNKLLLTDFRVLGFYLLGVSGSRDWDSVGPGYTVATVMW